MARSLKIYAQRMNHFADMSVLVEPVEFCHGGRSTAVRAACTVTYKPRRFQDLRQGDSETSRGCCGGRRGGDSGEWPIECSEIWPGQVWGNRRIIEF